MTTSDSDLLGPVTRFSLDNDLTVLLKPMDHAPSVSTHAWVEAGSLYEDATNNGLSHFLEHMLFKGTEKFTGDEINRTIENLGGKQNAATSKDYTYYHVKLPDVDWKKGLELLHQMTLHPKLPRDEFEKEREVVLSELARYRDNPKRLLWLKFIPQIYEQHPYSQLTIGSREVLEDVTHSQLVNYHEKFYSPGRMKLVVAGNFDESEVRDYAEELFDPEPTTTGNGNSIPEASPPSSDNVEFESKDIAQVYGIIGTTGVTLQSGHTTGLDLLMTVLGKGKSSRLYKNIVLEKDLATSISASFWTQEKTGPIMVRFQTDPDQVDDLLGEIRREIDKLVEEGITNEELERAKTQLRTNFLYSLQTSNGVARKLGYWETVASLDYLRTYLERIQSASVNELEQLARDILVEQHWRGTVFVPD